MIENRSKPGGWLARAMIAVLRVYRIAFSPFLGRICRFEPSCSKYAIACLETHGFFRGGLLSIQRLCKCHPFHAGGFDPPPPRLSPSRPTLPALEARADS